MTRNNRPSISPEPYLDHGRLLALKVMLCARLDDLLAQLGVALQPCGKLYRGTCPVHLGDNPGALNLYPEGDSEPGYWRCNTRHCEQHFQKSILGFVRGVLSQQRCNWSRPGDTVFAWRDTVDWCCRFLGRKLAELSIDQAELDRRDFTGVVARLNHKVETSGRGHSREVVRRWLVRPADYFVRRGWSAEVLDRYDVGLYPAQGRPLSGRVAVPIYDPAGQMVIGFTGRSTHEQCSRCARWHAPTAACPDSHDGRTAKWYNHDFQRDSVLYNWWFARPHIEDSGVVALVEGPGDLWRLEEAGVHCGLALLGSSLGDYQQVLLERSGAMTVVVLTNMDEAGRLGALDIRKRLERLCRVVVPDLPAGDLGELPATAVRDLVVPLIDRHRRI